MAKVALLKGRGILLNTAENELCGRTRGWGKMSLPGINKDQILIRYPSKCQDAQLDIGFCSKNAGTRSLKA